MSFSKKEFRKKEKELMIRAAEIEAQSIDSDPGSYEEYRDGFRFMAKVAQYAFIVSLMLNVTSGVFLYLKKPGKTYITSTDGKVIEVKPIAESKARMKAVLSRFSETPEKLLEMRDHYNPPKSVK